ncbi:YppE family protein [Ectobacillus ponti]|uniref:YppE family protein n=1 Tax=Ectobacillus ponti TaxID=2961894 RepID=A0AA41X8S6_9BACI|nr:YppE family protein [Ectobacillus ponti]MCP8968794.1 YppE family protein [Ectobacillus ponti]
MEEKVEELTRQLLERNDEMLLIHETVREFSFYEDIKPFVEETDDLLARWQEAALTWMREHRPKYIHASQIRQTHENLQNNALACFGTQKERRFKQTHQAIRYTLAGLLDELAKHN